MGFEPWELRGGRALSSKRGDECAGQSDLARIVGHVVTAYSMVGLGNADERQAAVDPVESKAEVALEAPLGGRTLRWQEGANDAQSGGDDREDMREKDGQHQSDGDRDTVGSEPWRWLVSGRRRRCADPAATRPAPGIS